MYEELLLQSPTDPAIVMRMVGASAQHARILDQLGNSQLASEAIQRGTEILQDSTVSVQIPESEKHLWLARLSNEQGNYVHRSFGYEEADACFRKAIEFAQKLPEDKPKCANRNRPRSGWFRN